MRTRAILLLMLGTLAWRASCEPVNPSSIAAVSAADADDEEEYVELSTADVEDVERAFNRFQQSQDALYSVEAAESRERVVRIAGLPGIFDVSRKLSHLRPQPPKAVNPHFLVYANTIDGLATEASPEPVMTLRHDDNFTAVSKYVGGAKNKLYIVVHGYRSKGRARWVQRIKDEILAVENATVVVVDWSAGARVANYSVAAGSTRTVARLAATLVKALVDAGTLSPSRVHYIGHSLGAQAGGFFGQDVQDLTGAKVGRITGLDPAGPLFEYFDAYLSKEHADFVDIIHTSMGMGFNFFRGRLGITKATGHVDFYPNGGKQQPGCKAFGRLDCSHARAALYYANSIRTCSYPALPCSSYAAYKSGRCTPCDQVPCGYMGHNANANLRGKHYLSISSESPYCPGAAATYTASLLLLLSSLVASLAVGCTARH
ncbi:pancreatic triacylglycerol lipase-like [Haemaphysalis longicornis]